MTQEQLNENTLKAWALGEHIEDAWNSSRIKEMDSILPEKLRSAIKSFYANGNKMLAIKRSDRNLTVYSIREINFNEDRKDNFGSYTTHHDNLLATITLNTEAGQYCNMQRETYKSSAKLEIYTFGVVFYGGYLYIPFPHNALLGSMKTFTIQ
jgi:hypothetical protein